jgi:hypothetical protein
MAKSAKLVRDEAYDVMGAAYQCVVTVTLDEVLKRHGVKSAATRRKVAEEFLFELGDFHDTGWLRPAEGAKPVYPILSFSEQFLNLDTPPAALGTVYLPSPGFAFHEYAHGCVGAYYDGDPAARVETGTIDDEPDAIS